MKKEETNTNESKTYYIVYRYNENTNDIENIFDSNYPLEIVNKFGFNEKHFNDYILKDVDDWSSSERRFNNMFIIKDTD